MPTIRPFRALRYDRDSVDDLTRVVAPPYDVISLAQRETLAARHPKNIVRLDLPTAEQGDEPNDRYRRAARLLASWRSDGTFRKDPRPSIYAYEQTYTVPGTDVERTQRGFFARLRLEPFGPGGVLPHERTLAAPREDRYLLLRATGVNTSPVIGLYDDDSGRAERILALLTAEVPPAIDIRDDDGTRHRLWAVPVEAPSDDAPAAGGGDSVSELVALAARGPITIADGHHRYETALRYRDERRMTRSCEEDPAFDYLLMLFMATSEPITVLPTHRIVREVGLSGDAIRERLASFFRVTPVTDRAELERAFEGAALAPGGRGRFGAWWRAGGALLEAIPGAFDPFFESGHEALGSLDVARIGVVLERALGVDAERVAAGGLAFTKAVREALDAVDAGTDGAALAFLLEPTPVASVAEVAAAGDVMPQKSTYFYPKALSGLLVNPLEW